MMPRRNRGGRPRKPEGTAATVLVPLKLSEHQCVWLDELVEVRRRELSEMAGGAKVEVTRSSVLREALLRELERRGIGGGSHG